MPKISVSPADTMNSNKPNTVPFSNEAMKYCMRSAARSRAVPSLAAVPGLTRMPGLAMTPDL